MHIPEVESRPKAAFKLADFAPQTLAALCGPHAFAFFGGYADASGYILTGAFPGHITGAVVLVAIGAAGRDWRNFFLRLGGVAAFLIGVAIAESLAEELQRRLSHYVLTLVISIELILFWLGYLAVIQHVNSARALLVICMSLALGMQNGAWRSVGGTASAHTTFLTGMSINLVATETGQLLDSSGVSRRPSLQLPANICLAFFLGATLGAAAALRFDAGAMLVAGLLLVLMTTASAVRIKEHSSTDIP